MACDYGVYPQPELHWVGVMVGLEPAFTESVKYAVEEVAQEFWRTEWNISEITNQRIQKELSFFCL